jgi:hypothetical protein
MSEVLRFKPSSITRKYRFARTIRIRGVHGIRIRPGYLGQISGTGAGTGVSQSRNAVFLLVLTGVDHIIVLRDRDLAVCCKAMLLFGVRDVVGRQTVFLISEDGDLWDGNPGPLWDIVNSGVVWLEVTISEGHELIQAAAADLYGSVHDG